MCIIQTGILIIGGIGLIFAGWRCRTADRNLLKERCQIGMDLLSRSPQNYAGRVAGAAILSDILSDKSREYDEAILRVFEATLFSPSVFGGDFGDHRKNDVDYESRETYIIVCALQKYKQKKGSLDLLELPTGSVFKITSNDIQPNKDHIQYKRWKKARKKCPRYLT